MSDSNSESSNGTTHHQTYNGVGSFKRTARRKNMGHLPSEILKFVRNESYSLLIKGKPGTGKTTFALTLLDNLNDDSNYFYISTRLSLKQLAFYFPWIEKFFSKDDNKSGYRFEDARLDEPESLFERITNQLMDVKSPVIFIDTWDTIASFMDRESRLNNERVLQIWRERAGAKLIFLSETFELGILDSIVDGVITLENHFNESNNNRFLKINKLRGLPILCNTYSYSLYKGVFYSSDLISRLNLFESYRKVKPYYRRRSQLTHKKSISGDNKEFPYFEEENFFIQNKMIRIAFDKSLSNEVLLSVLLKPIITWLGQSNDNRLMINNFDEAFRDSCKNILSHHLSEEICKLKIIEQEIDFTGPHAIKLTKQNQDSIFDISKKLSVTNSTQTKKFRSDADAFLSKLNTPLNSRNQINILNIINTNNMETLLSEDSFLDLLTKTFTTNIMIQRSSLISSHLRNLNNCIECELKISGKNLLFEIKTCDKSRYQMIVDKDRLFVNWHPVL
ncbi:MAG TPA: gas vesicle protein GvpD P-loop domain-containing protein [Candidatus Nitrosocosmicus sp.]|nr:gas vesicle protein GvpD P-loop domain-containing protein [Candidatus Nitrosocosmicus sp.]